MGKKLEEITLRYVCEKIRFDRDTQPDDPSVALITCEKIEDRMFAEDIIVKVESLPTDFICGLEYRFYGTWTNHPKYGRQFHAKTFIKTQPHGRHGVIQYLKQAPHVGAKIATTLWEKFNGDAVRILREQPDVASAAVGGQFNEARAKEAAAHLEFEKRTEDATIDLTELLSGRGFPKATAKKAIAQFGNIAAELIRRNPFLLMRFRGCGFQLCYRTYLDLGGDPSRRKVQALCAWYCIARNTEGHTWHTPRIVELGLRERLGAADVRPVEAVVLAKRGQLLATHRNGTGDLWLAEARKAKAEQIVAERVRSWLSEEAPNWPGVDKLDVSDHQRETLLTALGAPISIFTGGPGTGKTYSAARVINKLLERGGGDIAVAAPTGKAAVRISEVMQGYGVGLKATTCHSLLKVAEADEGDGWGFEHNANNPLPHGVIVVDESSMIDTNLGSSLFQACAKGTHLLLVGDTGQLPPVGHGAPMRDLIAAGVPTGELTEVRRNSGMIVQACHAIRSGSTFGVASELDLSAGRNLKLLSAATPKVAIDQIVRTIRKIGSMRLANPIWDCQVIVAVNEKSELGRKAINAKLQAELNPGGARANGNPFRIGDKIVCNKNSFLPIVEDAPPQFNKDARDGKVFVANGEQAAVKHVEPQITIAQLDAPARIIKIPRGKDGDGTGCQFELAYGISCHKSQGSEWPIVFVVLDEYPGAKMVCSREWLYTGMSRGKQVVFLVGKLATAHGMIDRLAIAKRKTFLKELIQCK